MEPTDEQFENRGNFIEERLIRQSVDHMLIKNEHCKTSMRDAFKRALEEREDVGTEDL